jgi:hypothetical protein
LTDREVTVRFMLIHYVPDTVAERTAGHPTALLGTIEVRALSAP